VISGHHYVSNKTVAIAVLHFAAANFDFLHLHMDIHCFRNSPSLQSAFSFAILTSSALCDVHKVSFPMNDYESQCIDEVDIQFEQPGKLEASLDELGLIRGAASS
jgi:hypothetical protein